VTSDLHSEAEPLPALLEDELSPELALVDPDVAERARDAMPDVTLTEIRVSLSIKIEQAAAPAVQQPAPKPVAVAESAPASLQDPPSALVRPGDRPAPPAYDDIRGVFHEPRLSPRSRRRSTLAALVILGVAAGVALAMPRALDGPKTSANRRSSAAGVPVVPGAHRKKAKGPSKAKPKAHAKAAAGPTVHAHPAHKAKRARRAPKRHGAVPPVSHRKPKAPVGRQRVLPDFVWVPVKNASGYLVEFRSGSEVVLRARTRAAKLRVLARQLRRGRYRWLVWVVGKSGSPVGKPIVDSNVTIR
jgi:hypothetical protein